MQNMQAVTAPSKRALLSRLDCWPGQFLSIVKMKKYKVEFFSISLEFPDAEKSYAQTRIYLTNDFESSA